MYYTASPDNPRQRYLFSTTLDGQGKSTRITPLTQSGTHSYEISPDQKMAFHSFNSSQISRMSEVVNLPDHSVAGGKEGIEAKLSKVRLAQRPIEFLIFR
jgi:dipeptidyl-peptidase-4